jgi:hypothetical protein
MNAMLHEANQALDAERLAIAARLGVTTPSREE